MPMRVSLDFPVIYTNGKSRHGDHGPRGSPEPTCSPLFELIFKTIPPAPGTADGDLQIFGDETLTTPNTSAVWRSRVSSMAR